MSEAIKRTESGPQGALDLGRRIEGKAERVDTVAKYFQAVVFGIWDLPIFAPMPAAWRSLNELLSGFINFMKGTKIVKQTDTMISKEKKAYSEEKASFWKNNHWTKVVSTLFITVVAVFDTINLCRILTGAAKLGKAARCTKDGMFIGGMTFAASNSILEIRKAKVQKKESDAHFAKWMERQSLLNENKTDLIAKYQDAPEGKSEKWRENIRILGSTDISALKKKYDRKVVLWKNAVDEGGTKKKSAWVDLAKNINKFVQLIFSLTVFLLAPACLPLLIVDVAIKVSLAHWGMGGLIFDECKYKPKIEELPNNFDKKVEQWTQKIK